MFGHTHCGVIIAMCCLFPMFLVQAHNSRYPGSEISQIGLVGEKERCAYFRVGIVEMAAAALTFAWGALTMGLGVFLVLIEEFLLVAILAALTSAIWMIWFLLSSSNSLNLLAARGLENDENWKIRKIMKSDVHDAAVQCDNPGNSDTSSMPVYAGPNSRRWHSRKSCPHLKAAMHINTLTPCQTCSPP